MPFTPPGVALSSKIDDIDITTDEDSVIFTLLINDEEVIKERYYTNDGKVYIRDLASVVSQYMLTDNITWAKVKVIAETDGHNTDYVQRVFHAICCSYIIDRREPAEFFSEFFLTLNDVRRLPLEAVVDLWWVDTALTGDPLVASAVYLGADGGQGVCSFEVGSVNAVTDFGIFSRSCSLASLAERVAREAGEEAVVMRQVTFTCGSRSATVYIDDSLSDNIPFLFLNCFNVPESVFLTYSTSEKLKVSKSIASFGVKSIEYDVTPSKEYESAYSALAPADCAMLEQMMRSSLVKRPCFPRHMLDWTDFDSLPQVIVTEFTPEFSDGNEKLGTLKFTWRYAINGIYAGFSFSLGYFDSKFNPSFT